MSLNLMATQKTIMKLTQDLRKTLIDMTQLQLE
jgi:hypothetical protein